MPGDSTATDNGIGVDNAAWTSGPSDVSSTRETDARWVVTDAAESADAWTDFLDELNKRGLRGRC